MMLEVIQKPLWSDLSLLAMAYKVYLHNLSSAIQPFFEGLCMEDIENQIVKSWNVGSPSNGKSCKFAFCNFMVIVIGTQENLVTNSPKQL